MKYLYLGVGVFICLVIYFVVKFLYENLLFTGFLFVSCIIIFTVYLDNTKEERAIKRKNREEKERKERDLQKIEEQRKKALQEEKEKAEQNEIYSLKYNSESLDRTNKELTKLIESNYNYLKEAEEKNNFLKQEKKYIEHCTVALNIHDKDFLNDYPQLLDYIEDVKKKGDLRKNYYTDIKEE